MRSFCGRLCVAFAFALPALSNAAPVDVTYTVSGASGNYTLNFTVINNIIAGQNIYFFGTRLSARDIIASPPSWDPDVHLSWDNIPFGGAISDYNNNWLNPSVLDRIAFGSSLGGFEVHITDLVAPASVNWFAFALGPAYQGPGCFICGANPGFEGIALSAVPEPATLALLGLGLAGLGFSRRKK